MMKGKFVLWIAVGILLSLSLWINKEPVIRMTALRLAGITDLMADTEFVDPDTLTIDDFSDIPGVTQEYVDAYKLFLKAKAGDNQKPNYEEAAAAFLKIAKTTKNPELKLRSLYLVTLCNFLQLKIDEAYKSGMEVLKLSKELLKGDKRIALLEKVVSAIKKGEISSAEDLKKAIESEGGEALEEKKIEEVSGFVDELLSLQEGAKKYEEMKAKVKK